MTNAHDLHTRIITAVTGRDLFRPDDTLIIALSGGADSTALLDLLATLPGYSLRLVAAHLNHCLRGADSDADETFCRELAARYSIPFESRRADVRGATAASRNLEDAGRRARLAFFEELAGRWGATGVVLAHHADDLAETMLMRLLRGSGVSGLSGIAWHNARSCIRPLLGISRAELQAYLAGRGLTWREDASNRDTRFLRNRIRHELLPLLEEYNPSVRDTLTTTAEILSEEDSLLEQQTQRITGQLCTLSGVDAACDISQLTAHPLALQRRIVRQMLAHLAGNLELFGHRHITAILDMAASPRPNLRIDLPQGLLAVREYTGLRIQRAEIPRPGPVESTISGPGDYPLPDGSRLRIDLRPATAVDLQAPSCVSIDIDRAPFPWQIRTFRPGDRIRLPGMNGRKKVKDVFIDGKIPTARRTMIPLVFCGPELIWIVGLRTAQTGRLDRHSTRAAACLLSP